MRIININDHDLNLFSFDYDLTMAIVLGNADGSVYHRYGGRTDVSPMNMGSLIELMKAGLETHRNYKASPNPPDTKPPQRADELINERMRGIMDPVFGCVHCHYVREAQQYVALENRTWSPNQFWVWPLPKQIGLVMNPVRQNEIDRVLPNSPAERAGIAAGDQLQTLGGRRVLTRYDIQWVLDQSVDDAVTLPFSARRNNRPLEGELKLEPAWKAGDPDDYAWRVRNIFTEHMTKFLPTPGFIGDQLADDKTAVLGLPAQTFALRVNRLNQGTHLAGIRLGDVVLSAGGRSDFDGKTEFFRWCELLRRAGRDIRFKLLRDGSQMNVMVGREYLNFSRIEKAPKVAIGFVVQELPGDGGLRVGHVTDGSSAEKTGLLVGDRILTVEGEAVRRYDRLQEMLNQKSPGDLLLIHVKRGDEKLQFSYILPGEEALKSRLARLSANVTEKGQILTCVVSLKLPPGKHVYSMHKKGFGLPTKLEFRGGGYRLIGPPTEPVPKRIDGGISPMWILEGDVEFVQKIEITDPGRFLLLMDVFAQVCDDRNCHEIRALIANDGSSTDFFEFRGDVEKQPVIRWSK